MFLGDEDGSGNDQILREQGGSRRRHIARNDGQIERSGFLQAASSSGEAKSQRESGF
jgi:hypothetical protein